jgi:integrase
MPPKVLALPGERIERALCNTGVTAQDVRALVRSDDWCALHSHNEQLVFFYEFVKMEYSRPLTSEVLGHEFGIEPSHVRKIRSKAEKKPKPPYRPAALNEDQTAAVVAFIENGHRTRNYVTQRDVLGFIETNFQKCLRYQCMASFLKKHANLIGRSAIRPQENVRLKVPHEYLDQYIRLIKEYVPLVPTELLFNIDESCFSDWEERKPKCVLIPTEAREATLHYPASRKIRHQTLLCCVTAARDVLSSSCIIGRRSTGSI